MSTKVNLNEFAKFLCSKETGKSEVNIAQMKEILKIISCEMYCYQDLHIELMKYGQKVAERVGGADFLSHTV